MIGLCFACNHPGPFEEKCDWCVEGRHLGPDYGMCAECEWLGTVGVVCPMCNEALIVEIPEDSDTEAEGVIVIMVPDPNGDPETDFDSDSDSDSDSDTSFSGREEPVADRTRSHAGII